MAAINFNDMGDRDDGSLATAINWAGAFLSVLLIAGLATWGWKLWQRDVTGIPVVRALEGPMRITPADPGGLANNYQGLAVNRIAEERATELTDRVVLAPAPATLNEDEDFANQVKDIENIALDFAESQLHQQIGNNNTTATIFYLKTKGKKRGYIERQEITGADGIPNNFQIEIIDKTEDTN